MAEQVFTVVGAGLAGGRAAEALRELGFDGRVVLIGSEPERPYERPPLSKAYLSGELPEARVFLRPAGFYAEQQIELLENTTVEAIDLGARRLRLSTGARAYDRLLLATGSRPRRLEVPGAELPGISTYRTLADARRLHEHLARRPRVLVVGAGFLGSELAAVARQTGCPVTLVETADSAPAALGQFGAEFCQRLHREQGVSLRLGRRIESFAGADAVESAQLDSGQRVPCDLVLVCIGAAPRIELAQSAGLALADDGVRVDASCRTSAADVFAAGDIASWPSSHLGGQARVEHYDNAHRQGRFAAGAMLQAGGAYDPIPYFWTELYGNTVQTLGRLSERDRVVLRGDPRDHAFSAFYLRGSGVAGCLAVNRFRDLTAARRLMATSTNVAASILADPLVDLRQLAPAPE